MIFVIPLKFHALEDITLHESENYLGTRDGMETHLYTGREIEEYQIPWVAYLPQWRIDKELNDDEVASIRDYFTTEQLEQMLEDKESEC